MWLIRDKTRDVVRKQIVMDWNVALGNAFYL